MHTYDRVTRSSKLISIDDVAQRRRFYERFMTASSDPALANAVGTLERAYQRWETALQESTAVAARVASGGGRGTLEERETMAIAAAVQLVRTPRFRDGIVDGVTEDMQREFEQHLRETNPALADQIVGRYRMTITDDALPSFLHAIVVWETDTVQELAGILYHYLWIIGKNRSRIPLYTSDHPVATILHDPFPAEREQTDPCGTMATTLSLLGDRASPRAIEIAFPLSPDLVLLMYHPDRFPHLRLRQGQTLLLGTDTVTRLNEAQAGQCDRQVYSVNGDFVVAARATGATGGS